MTKKNLPAISIEPHYIAQKIYTVRGQKVILDAELAFLYGVTASSLNRAVKRNIERFPDDFMFQLTEKEAANLRLQSGTSKRGGRTYLPYAFTEHGVAMLSSVLRSERAVHMNIAIIRAFVNMRGLLAANKDLANRVEKLEGGQKRQNAVIEWLAEEIESIKAPPPASKKRRIGYV